MKTQDGAQSEYELNKLKQRIAELEQELSLSQKELEQSRKEFQYAFEDPAIGMMRTSPEGHILAANAYVCRMMGYTEGELKQKHYKEITHPDDIDASVLSEHKILSRELRFDRLEKRYIKKNGEVVWILLSYSMLFDRHDRPMYYVCHLQDITERKKIEQDLQASEKRFALFMDNLPGAASIMDHDGRYIYVNEFLLNHCVNDHPDGILGLTDQDLYPPDYSRQYEKNSDLTKSEGRPVTFVETIPGGNTAPGSSNTPDSGREEYWLTCRFPILLKDNPPLLGCVRLDTSDLIRAKQKLKLKEKELEKHAESLNEANTALKVLLDHREQEKIQLEQNMFANLKKLVSPYLEKLENKPLDRTQKAFLEIARSNLDSITSPLAAKLLSWEARLTPTEFDIADLIRHGKSTDAISELLNISSTTVAFHRRNIRLKLGLKNRKINLMTHLRSIS
ncbi:MAG: PAS domain S-box protein [Desulfobacterales bacterium]|nr:PAS domain S-box protein [Desulfobacterales bacterium]